MDRMFATRAIVGLVLTALTSTAAHADTPQERLKILTTLAGVETKEGLLVRKLLSPVSFLMFPSYGAGERLGAARPFFDELFQETDAFLRDTLGGQYEGRSEPPTIQVEVAYPPTTFKGSAEEWLDHFFPTAAQIADDPTTKDSYLSECFGVVQNVAYLDPAGSQVAPEDAFDVMVAASTRGTIVLKGASFDENEARRCYYRHLMAALGLRGTVRGEYESVLSERKPAQRPTEFDRWLVKTLYESKGDPGTLMTVAFPQLVE